ncbi:hypothetical protein PBY51_003308 [Eleginops maclovinus]|uniref:Uncharacterized protein n=1 Tax=Eleginops maclovinus TaxID=56733 RepID=A0AAN8AE01_ELEMC|nr:hypothetical protein PBY51_003308 [Eleginops maclovinus]
MTGRDESNLQSPIAMIMLPLHVSIFLSHPSPTPRDVFTILHEQVLTETSEGHQWDFPTKVKVLFVTAQRQMDRLFGRLRSCLIFQFNETRRWRPWDGIIDPDPASSAIYKC